MEQNTGTSNIEKAKAFYGLVQEGKWAEASNFVADDFTTIEADDLPFGGALHGKAAIQKSFALLMESMDITGIEFHVMTAGGDYVVSVLDIVAKGDGGRELRLGIAEVMKFCGELICEVKPHYFDHKVVREAVDYQRSKKA